MADVDSKKKLLEYLARSIVENPEAVKIAVTHAENQTILHLEVDNQDLGLIIGKRGKTIQAIRHLIRLQIADAAEKIDVQLNDERQSRGEEKLG
jgi:predicted RNA-binding protein YlqC (UPF0109 family)